MACCEACEKSGGSCGGQSDAAKKLYSGGYEYAPVPGSLTCPTCRYYAWSDRMTPVLDVHGGCHHPACGSVWDIDRNWFPPSRGDGGAGLGAPRGIGAGPAPSGIPYKIYAPQQLLPGQSLVSPNGKFFFVLQGDGNLVSKTKTGFVIWAAGTNGRGVARAVMQYDGNFVLYDARWRAIWATNTAGRKGALLQQQDDGNVVLYDVRGNPLWSTFWLLPFHNLSISVAGVPGRLSAASPASAQDPGGAGDSATSASSGAMGYVIGAVALAAIATAAYEISRAPSRHTVRAVRRRRRR